MNTRVLIALLTTVALTIPAMASAQQVPAEVPIQAYLTDDQGVPVDGNVTVDFTIYDSASGTNDLHSEQQVVDAEAGAFTAYLTPDLSIFENNTDLHLGLAIDGGSEMFPRLQIATVPYAAVAGQAADAATLDGMSSSDFAPSGYQPDWSDIQNAPAGLNSSCSSGEVLKWDGSAWACAADDTASYGAGAGLALSGSDFEVDFSATQQRVSDSCGTGEYISAINQDGTVVCNTDQDSDTTYDAGSGLALNGTTFSIESGGVTNDHLAGSIDPTKITGEAATLNGSNTFSGGITASDFSYDSGGLSVYQIPASAFIVDNSTDYAADYRGFGYIGNGGYSGSYGRLFAPVNLPRGIEMTAFSCRAYDNNTSSNLDLRAYLRKRTWNSTTYTTIADTGAESTTGSSTNIQHFSDTSLSETYDPYDEYYIYTRFAPEVDGTTSLRFYGCMIFVSPQKPGYY